MRLNFQVFFYAALSAVLLSLGIPNEILPFGSPFIGLFSLVPLYIAFSLVVNPRQAFFCGAIQFSLTHLLSSFWLAFFKDFALFTLGLTALCYFVAGGIIGLALWFPFYITSQKRHQLNELSGSASFSSSRRVLWFAAAWTLHEWGKSTGFLAYPWGTLIQSAWKWQLITQIVAVTGSWGLSFLFSLFSGVTAEAVLKLKWNRPDPDLARISAFCTFLFASVLVYGTIQYTKVREPIAHMDTVLVQMNGDSWIDGAETLITRSEKLTTQAIEQDTQDGTPPDLVVWSETVLNYLLPDYWYRYAERPKSYPLKQSIIDTGSPYIIGSPWIYNREKEQYQNAAVLFDSNGEIVKHHAKIHLVPFAESIPYIETAWMQTLMEVLAGFSSSWTGGTEYTTFEIPLKDGNTIKISTPICFEDAFPDVCRNLYLSGSQAFVNITNDSWSMTNSAEIQHFVIASYRAQEFRTTLVRSTNGGYSTVVDPAGRIIADMPLFTATSLRTSIPIYASEMTVYARFGDWLPLLCLCIILVLLFQLIRMMKK